MSLLGIRGKDRIVYKNIVDSLTVDDFTFESIEFKCVIKSSEITCIKNLGVDGNIYYEITMPAVPVVNSCVGDYCVQDNYVLNLDRVVTYTLPESEGRLLVSLLDECNTVTANVSSVSAVIKNNFRSKFKPFKRRNCFNAEVSQDVNVFDKPFLYVSYAVFGLGCNYMPEGNSTVLKAIKGYVL